MQTLRQDHFPTPQARYFSKRIDSWAGTLIPKWAGRDGDLPIPEAAAKSSLLMSIDVPITTMGHQRLSSLYVSFWITFFFLMFTVENLRRIQKSKEYSNELSCTHHPSTIAWDQPSFLSASGSQSVVPRPTVSTTPEFVRKANSWATPKTG